MRINSKFSNTLQKLVADTISFRPIHFPHSSL